MTDVVAQIRAQKADLRRRMRTLLASIPAEALARASADICRHLEASDLFARAHAVLLFLPLPGEVDLRPLASRAIDAAKAVYILRVAWETRAITPVRIADPLLDAPADDRGVPAPRAGLHEAPLADIDLILAPGLSFDLRAGRIGRAAGFYDRLLSDPQRRAPAIGVCLDAQIVDAVPREAHDQPVDGLVTESGLKLLKDSARRGPI